MIHGFRQPLGLRGGSRTSLVAQRDGHEGGGRDAERATNVAKHPDGWVPMPALNQRE